MIYKTKQRLGMVAIGFLLFASVAVDFASKLMSIGFDFVFAALIIFILWPTIKDVFGFGEKSNQKSGE